MRNLLALAAALVLIFLGLGWYFDWYRIKTTTTEDGHRQINIDLNTDRIKSDVGKARDLFDSKETPPSAPPPSTPPKSTPGTTTSFQREDGSFVYPGEKFTPVPPGSGDPKLPPPR